MTNLADAFASLHDPLGLDVFDDSGDLAAAAESQKVDTATFGAMLHRFDGQAGAFAYLLFILLLFILLYFPCVAATSAIHREAGGYWTLFAVGWTTGLAFFSSTLFYQLARYSQHPQQSLLWIGIAIGFFLGVYALLASIGRRYAQPQVDLQVH